MISGIVKKFTKRDLIIFILPLLVFSLYLFTYNPGILNVDSFSLLHQIATGEFSSAFPIFYTFLVIFGLKIYASPIIISIFQILIFSILWTIICRYHRKSENINEFFIQFILTLIISIIPINAVYSTALSSFALFGYCIMFMAFLVKVTVDRKGQITRPIVILMAVTMASISGLSPYGIYIALASLVLVAAYLLIRNQSRNTIALLIALTIVATLVVASMTIIYHAEDGDSLKSTNLLDGEINLEDAKGQYFSSINETPKESFEDVSAPNLKNSKYDQIDSIVSLTRENILLNTLLNNPITYLVLSVISLAFIYVTAKSRDICLIFIPSIVTLVIAAITSQVSLYSNLLVFYLIAVILIGLHFNGNSAIKDSARPVETAPITPQEEHYPEEDYSDLEQELEELTLDDINEMLGTSPIEEEMVPTQEETPKGDSDLIDEILKEIEMGKK